MAPKQPSASTRRRREIDLLAVGELLVDLISHEACRDLSDAENFRRYPGGSPANLAANMARTGNRTALVACLGEDGMGNFLRQNLEKSGVISDYVVAVADKPTTLILIGKTDETPDFIAYRMADRMILPEHIPDELLQRSSLYHTTCFALSRHPAQESILEGAKRARQFGCQLSIDVNYSPKIWSNRQAAQLVIANYCSLGALVKLSRDDIARLFDTPDISAENVISVFHEWGAKLVCLTRGDQGSLLSWNNGEQRYEQPARPVKVADATGAGDAFWAGFLTAYLDGKTPPTCALAGANLAAIKLQHTGPLSGKIPAKKLYEEW